MDGHRQTDGVGTLPPGLTASGRAKSHDPAHGLAMLLVELAVQIGAAEGRDEVLRAARAALDGGLPGGAQVAFARGTADGLDPPTGPIRVHTDRSGLAAEVPELAERLACHGSRWLTVPLTVGRHDLGTLGVTWPGLDEPDTEVIHFLVTTAWPAAQALRVVEERTREHEVTERLQRSLLPVMFPISGLDVEYRYQPAGRDALAGGDFYDLIELEPGLTTVIIGDVAGHGIDAAASSGEVRYLVRGVLEHTRDPAAVLCLVESAISRSGRAPTMVTLLCAQIDASENLLRMASAGHYAPIIRAASGEVHRAAVVPAPPLGAGFVHSGAPPREAAVRFGPGDVAVLYTDGLVERRAMPLDAMLAAVERVVARHASPLAICRSLADFAATERDHDDDLALLAVRRHPASSTLACAERVPPQIERV